MLKPSEPLKGLTSSYAKELQKKVGINEISQEKKEGMLGKVLHTISEPMFLLLIIAAVIYFILGEPKDAAIMLVFVIVIISIEVIQEWKTDKTLRALKDLSAPTIRVIRDELERVIYSRDLVPGDIMIISEGVKIPADGTIIKCNDLCVDESTLTGEAEGVWKIPEGEETETSDYWKKDYCYAGTLVIQGSAYVLVEKIGVKTEFGKISVNVAAAPEERTPLQKQTGKIVKICAAIAGLFFILVCIVTYFNIPDHVFKERIVESILSGITLAMATIPEEFPVVLTVFLSMGAWRLAKKKALVRRLPSVETLGSVSVLCVDKTGTITMNQMSVNEIWTFNSSDSELLEIMGMACETEAYDPMEKAMLEYCIKNGFSKERIFEGELITEYSFTNELKMMGHVWNKNNEIVVAAKGAPESIVDICDISEEDKGTVLAQVNEMSLGGMRVIAIAMTKVNNEAGIEKDLEDCKLKLCGLVGLIDPPRETVAR